MNVWRAYALGGQSDLLIELGASVDPRLRLVMALVWAVVWLGLAVALWRRRPFTRLALPVAWLLYVLYHLALLFFFVRSSVAQAGWLGYTLPALFILLYVTWVLNRPAARRYFGSNE
ncbi:MAG: hypothetical protein AB1791_03265 [Chloroflexota bacterium]